MIQKDVIIKVFNLNSFVYYKKIAVYCCYCNEQTMAPSNFTLFSKKSSSNQNMTLQYFSWYFLLLWIHLWEIQKRNQPPHLVDPEVTAVIFHIRIGKVAWFSVYICCIFWVTQYIILRIQVNFNILSVLAIFLRAGHRRLFTSINLYIIDGRRARSRTLCRGQSHSRPNWTTRPSGRNAPTEK